MAALKIVTGAGPVGWTVASQLAEQGHKVRVLTRSGSGPEHPLIERVKADVSGVQDLAGLFAGADAAFHCVHGSAYSATAWRRELARAEAAVLDAAGAAGAVAVFPESFYSYSRPEEPLVEDGPRNAIGGKRGIRTQLLAARAAHPTPTVSVAASDFFGPQVRNAHAGERMVPNMLAGKRVQVVASTSTPHSFTYIGDLAAAMVKAAAMPELWNSVLHAPTGPALTQAELAAAFARAAGAPKPKVGAIPAWFIAAAGVFSPGIHELNETLYQFRNPFIVDSSHSERLLGLSPTPLAEAALATVQWWRSLPAA
ncbi:NAD-dependent epimerase/dehydratase family protein [Pseudarthrobacter sp. P1]|uniref:NAD-dependent epimerase/dehydratase family protein n=1 Tax=Pseudarthrobacter sp. P1 TaxID=3418418 RepID=UPI003CEE7932